MPCWSGSPCVVSVILWIFSLIELLKSNPANIALNKFSKQSQSYGYDRPERGNDGNTSTNYDLGSCVHGHPSTVYPLPWWQVDLEWMYYVTSVVITNRDHHNAWRLHNFTIELYCEDPTVHLNAAAKVCAVYPGTVASGARVTLTCAPGVRGRYLRFQKNSVKTDDAVQFCELEAYGFNGTRSTFSGHPTLRLSGTPTREETGSPQFCGEVCHRMPCCTGFNFHSIEGSCKFMSNDNGELVADAAWNYFSRN
ncbi:fucolectin-3-like [Haliotis rubra]|uniref:fucolectin-3-like n=1 Tax=Haliotis rubra TaxID=36100 RepID=UPI001EE4F353|nr:fucolectin-3-like [Haliotis rubra]